jgi:hypothetical protein
MSTLSLPLVTRVLGLGLVRAPGKLRREEAAGAMIATGFPHGLVFWCGKRCRLATA